MRLTWWGHSTVSISSGQGGPPTGLRLLTDPLLGDRLVHLRRRAGITPPTSVTEVEAALVSHLHADHLDVPSLRRLDRAARLVLPAGGKPVVRRWSRALAARCEEVEVGDEVVFGDPASTGLRVRAVAAQHPGMRGPWSRHRGPALGYVVTDADGTTLWFAGDTGLGEFLEDLGPFDAALLPVGGWGPTLGLEHLDPVRALEATRRTRPRLVVPIHFGTFWPVGADRISPHQFARPGRDYADLVHRSGLSTEVKVLEQGSFVDVPVHQ